MSIYYKISLILGILSGGWHCFYPHILNEELLPKVAQQSG